MNISTQEMTKQEWLRERQKGIFSTDVSAILGINPYKTPLDIYYEKISEEPIEISENPRMKAGKKFEQAIDDWYCEESERVTVKDNKIRFHKNYPEIPFGANLDRLIISTNVKGPGILEIKTVSERVFRQWDTEVPKMYYLQVQHALNVTGHKWGEFAIWVAGMELQIFPFEYDKELIEMVNPKLLKFWNENVMKRILPEPINEEDIKKLYPISAIEKKIEAVEEVYKIVQLLKSVKDRIKGLEEEEGNISEKIKLMMMDAEILTYIGEPIITWKTSKSSMKFNANKFKEEHSDLYKLYLEKVQGSRRFFII